MQENLEKGEAAINIVNGLHARQVIEFKEDGQVNIVGNAHEQSMEASEND